MSFVMDLCRQRGIVRSKRRRRSKVSKCSLVVLAMIMLSLLQHAPRADAALQALRGFGIRQIMPIPNFSPADLDGDGVNVFGLSGLAGLASTTAVNAAVLGTIETVEDVAGNALRANRNNPARRRSSASRLMKRANQSGDRAVAQEAGDLIGG